MPSRPPPAGASPDPGVRRRTLVAGLVLALVVGLLAVAGLSRLVGPGAASGASPEPVSTVGYVARTTGPPWDLPPNQAVAIAAAGLEEQPIGLTTDQHRVRLSLTIDGTPVGLPAGIGIDQARAVQAQVHTHDDSGEVWLEGRNLDGVTLGQFFTLWGVRFTDSCVGATCGTVLVTTQPALDVTDPRALRLSTVEDVLVTVVSR